MHKGLTVVLVAAAMLAGAAGAEPVNGKSARRALFSHKTFIFQLAPDSGLTPLQVKLVKLLARDPALQRAASYYGAMAISPSVFEVAPSEGASERAKGLVKFTGNHHSPAAADRAALVGCERTRRRSDAACVVAARFLPKRWKTGRVLTLSQSATAALAGYRKAKPPKAFAISLASPAYGVARGENAAETALAACNADATRRGAPDCQVVIAD